MKTELIDALLLDDHVKISVTELAELSGLDHEALLALVDCDALSPLDPQAAQMHFSAGCVQTLRTASRLREDFGLNIDALALALKLVERIQGLENELRDLRAQIPHRPHRGTGD